MGCENHADRDRLRGVVESGLNDPFSAQYRNDRVAHQADGGLRYCGEVNARNALGGYVGFRPFVADDRGAAILAPDASAEAHRAFSALWANNCGANLSAGQAVD